MGTTLLEIESKQLKEFGQRNTTPPYAAIDFLGHLDPDLDLVSSRNDTGHSQWMSEKPELWQLDIACDLVRDRGLQYLWPDYWHSVTESSGLGSSRLEHLAACYERACWCLVFTPKSLYQHFHRATNSNGPSKTSMPPLGLMIVQGNSDSYYYNEEEVLHRNLRGEQMLCKIPVSLRLETLGKHHRQQWEVPSSLHSEDVAVENSSSYAQQDRYLLSLMDFHGQNEASYAFRSQLLNSITEGCGDSKQQESYHLYPLTEGDTCFQRSLTPQFGSRSLNVLRVEQQNNVKTLLPMITPSVTITTTSSLLLDSRFQPSKEGKFSNIRSWLDSTCVNPIMKEGGELSEPLPTIDPVDVGGNDMEDFEDTCSETTSKTEYQWQSLDEWAQLGPSLEPSHPLSFVKAALINTALFKYLGQKKQQQRHSGQQAQAPVSPNNQKRLEIACPFYKVDPLKYSGCLKGARLLTISQVKDHLLKQHRMPFYCPVCKSEFQTASNRDRHIVKRSCSLKKEFPHEGVSDDQRRLLLRRHRRVGLKEHWHKICVLLQLEISRSASPYLIDTTIVANEVMEFRNFWRKYGQSCIADFLMTVNLHHWNRQSEERDLASLYSAILEGVSETIIQWETTERHLGCISRQ
ncbi:HET and ankyrin domain protein [Colletotrichum graminicola]|nr:HET and ankyrin domain protein [Colletotrichum graminicola]